MASEHEYAVFILTYGRPDRVLTIQALEKQGYTGPIYLLCSDDDTTLPQYQSQHGERVKVFSKDEVASTFDVGDNFPEKRGVVYARNAVFSVAEQLGYRYFIVLDDDYRYFQYTADHNGTYHTTIKRVLDLDRAFNTLLKYYKSIPAKTLAISQCGDYLGGQNSTVFKKKLTRKAMNFFVCSTDRPFKYHGRSNEDTTTYVRQAHVGDIFLTAYNLRLHQIVTQSKSGGMTELYLSQGTYLKSFYTVMYSPSSVKVSLMGTANPRLHHRVSWKNTAPVILQPHHKK